jgi:hypothetical protein
MSRDQLMAKIWGNEGRMKQNEGSLRRLGRSFRLPPVLNRDPSHLGRASVSMDGDREDHRGSEECTGRFPRRLV